MKLPQAGGCQCGQVRYEITEEPREVNTCHCLYCQRLTSSAFSLGIVVPEKGFARPGLSHVGFNAPPIADASTPDWFARSAVPGSAACRGMAWSESISTLDDTSWLRPTRHIWTWRSSLGCFPRAMKFSRDSLPDTTETVHDPSRTVFQATKAGALYAIVVFSIGFMLGTIRVRSSRARV